MKAAYSFEEFMGGFPVKSTEATKDTMDGKAYRLGYQSAKLETDRAKLNEEKILFEQQKAAVIQQLLNAQAQMATMMGANAGASAALNAVPGMGGGMPPMPGGAMPPMDMGVGGGMPPMGGAPPMDMGMPPAPPTPPVPMPAGPPMM